MHTLVQLTQSSASAVFFEKAYLVSLRRSRNAIAFWLMLFQPLLFQQDSLLLFGCAHKVLEIDNQSCLLPFGYCSVSHEILFSLWVHPGVLVLFLYALEIQSLRQK
jgi:hypothetical protein